ncbi:Hypothetical protein NGAL_HAMBI490_23740 [Neorhizobium galegae bv. officinalis]|nr:Hypothetical protein NGAL_HAMBI490_23740 [Neorhizobium galegae bv. officinalis]
MQLAPGDTPLCPAGHLPLKGGDRQAAPASPVIDRRGRRNLDETAHRHGKLTPGLSATHRHHPISPLEGEMSGRTEGGAAPCAALCLHILKTVGEA